MGLSLGGKRLEVRYRLHTGLGRRLSSLVFRGQVWGAGLVSRGCGLQALFRPEVV